MRGPYRDMDICGGGVEILITEEVSLVDERKNKMKHLKREVRRKTIKARFNMIFNWWK